MKKTIALVAIFISAYLFFVIQSLPVSAILNAAPLPKNVNLGQASGSAWNFNLSYIQIDEVVVNDVNVDMRALSLLTFDPIFDIKFGSPMAYGPEGSVTVSGLNSQLSIENLNVTLAANDIARQLPLPVPVEAKSDVTMRIQTFVLGKPVCEVLDGQVDWRAASVIAMEERVELGDLSAKLACDKGNIIATIAPDNVLGLTFEAVVSENFRTQGDGHIKPTSKTPEAITQMLPFIGKPDNQGRYRLRF